MRKRRLEQGSTGDALVGDLPPVERPRTPARVRAELFGALRVVMDRADELARLAELTDPNVPTVKVKRR